MAKGTGTRYYQLSESLASVKQSHEVYQKKQDSLQHVVEGLAKQLQVVAANVDALVRSNGKKQEDSGNELGSQVTNPLFEEHGGIQTRAIRLDFPRFDGEDLQGWVYRANQFFTYHQTNPHHRVLLASFHMEVKALIWFQDLEASGGLTSWEGFVRALQTRFGTSVYHDPMQALMKLHQTTTVEAYKTQFETLSNQLRGLVEPYKLSYFLTSLREDIRFMVRMLNPQTLTATYGMAKMQEENVVAFRRSNRMGLGPTRPPLSLPLAAERKDIVSVQRLTPIQMKES